MPRVTPSLLWIACIAPSAIAAQRAAPTPRPARPDVTARALVDSAISAMFGSRSPAALQSLRIDGVQHEYVLGNAERPDGPWRALYTRFSELREAAGPHVRRTEWSVALASSPPPRVTLLTDSVLIARSPAGQETGAGSALREDYLDRLNASPERALMLARDATLEREPPVTRYALVRDVVSFAYRDGRMRLELNRRTHLPEAVEVTRTYSDDFRRGPFGDVTVRFDYENWGVEPDGFFWPRQHRVFLNGAFMRDVSIVALTLDAPTATDSFAVSDSGRALFTTAARATPRTLSLGDRGTLPDVAPGIVRVRDFWTMTAVRQDDGIVLFEAHVSDRYLGQVIADVEHKWAPLKVKAVVMTSDPWAHIGGVREVVARGLPIYVSALSIPFLKRLLASPHTLVPDRLARSPRAPRFVPISGKVLLGTGINRLELYPVGGPYAEHMSMAYFPAHRLLYGADLVFPAQAPSPPGAANATTPPAPSWFRPGAVDLRRAVARERLAVDSLFCVQPTVPPIAWSTFIPAGMTAGVLP